MGSEHAALTEPGRRLKIVHGSDLHFGTPHLPESARAFRDAVVDIEPDVLVISGDLTQRAKVEECRQASEFLKSLPELPTVVVPGNHDVPLYRVWERLTRPLKNYTDYISADLDTITRLPGAVIVGLDSTAPYRAIVNGRLTESQLRFAEDAFSAAGPDDIRILVAHHPFASAPDFEGDYPIPGRSKLLRRMEASGVALILGGHLHRAYLGDSKDVYPHKRPARGLHIIQSGTTSSNRGRAREIGKNTFNLLRIDRISLEVIQYQFDGVENRFRPARKHLVPLDPTSYLNEDPLKEASVQESSGSFNDKIS